MYDSLPEELSVEADGPVRIVRLNRPDDLNAVNAELHRGLAEVWPLVDADMGARAVVLTGEGRAFSAGIEQYSIENTTVRVYNAEKTLADCFKYRNKIGLDVAVEALKLYRERRSLKVDDIMRFARTCRIEKIIRPYLEATL